jgi:hypothetical protein
MVVLAVLHLLVGLFFAAGGVALTAGTDVRFPFVAAKLFTSAAVGLTLAGTLLAHPSAANEVVAWERERDSWGLGGLAARLIKIFQAVTAIVCSVTLIPPVRPIAENSRSR